jgi:uncharacterized protein (TIGR03437 family)
MRLNRFEIVVAAAIAMVGPSWGQPVVQAVLNGASYSGNIAPGTWVSIFGTQLANTTTAANGVPLQISLGGVSVAFGGIAAPLSYVSAGQINAVVPFEITVPGSAPVRVPVVVTTTAGPSAPLNVSLSRESPGLFTLNGAGTGAVIAFDANFRLLPAAGAGPIVLYADGLGPTNPPASSASGGASAEPLNRVVDNVSVFVGDTQATVAFAGLAPGFPGIYQLNVIPNGPLSDRVYIKANGWQSNIVSLPISPGSNVANVSAAINGLYPPSSFAVTSSAMLIAGTFSLDLDILPGARPFSVVAAGDGGNAVIAINPGSGTWQATLSMPTPASRAGDFSQSGFNVVDFSTCASNGTCMSFPNNVIPVSRLDPAAVQAVNMLPLPNGLNGIYTATGALPLGGHFSIGPSTLSNLANFGGFLQIPAVGSSPRTASFRVYVDGKLIASKDVSYNVAHP